MLDFITIKCVVKKQFFLQARQRMNNNNKMVPLQIAFTFAYQFKRFAQELKAKIEIEQSSMKSGLKYMIREQKAICKQLTRLLKITKYFGQHFCQFQTQIIKQTVLYVFKNIFQQVQGCQACKQSIQTYNYFFNNFSFLYQKLKRMEFSQNSKLLRNPIIGKDINQILNIFRQEVQAVSPEGIYSNTTLAFRGFHVSSLKDQNIIKGSIQLIKNKQQNLAFAKTMCQMMNKCDGIALFVGLDDENRVVGVQLTDNECKQIKQNIMRVRKQMIFPKISVMQKFSINFTKVEDIKNQSEQQKQQKQKIEKVKVKKNNEYIIKIYVKTRSIGKCYFVQEPTKQDKRIFTYSIYNGDNAVIPQKVYQEIIKKDKQRVVRVQYIKKNISEYFQIIKGGSQVVAGGKVILQKEQNKKVQKTNFDYGKPPHKRFAYHSIIVVSSGQKAREKFNDLLEFMKDESEYFLYNQIYEKMNKTNNRLIYYMTHRRNPEELLNFCNKADKDRKYLVFNKIKPQLSFLRNTFIYTAVQTGKARYENHFGKQLQIVYKRSQQNKNTNQYYFIFETQQQAIFLFCLLQYANIRTNFANQKKTEGTIPVEPDHLQALLDPKNKV